MKTYKEIAEFVIKDVINETTNGTHSDVLNSYKYDILKIAEIIDGMGDYFATYVKELVKIVMDKNVSFKIHLDDCMFEDSYGCKIHKIYNFIMKDNYGILNVDAANRATEKVYIKDKFDNYVVGKDDIYAKLHHNSGYVFVVDDLYNFTGDVIDTFGYITSPVEDGWNYVPTINLDTKRLIIDKDAYKEIYIICNTNDTYFKYKACYDLRPIKINIKGGNIFKLTPQIIDNMHYEIYKAVDNETNSVFSENR